MNKVYRSESAYLRKEPMTPAELADAANAITSRQPFTANDFTGEHSRIAGNHCSCCGNGAFVLMPLDDPHVIGGGKRYMYCMNCDEVSHL